MTQLLPSDVSGSAGWSRASRLEASDPGSGSGLTELHYQIDSHPEIVIRSDSNLLFSERRTLSAPLPQEGKFNLLYYAIDRAGNQEPVQQRTLQIDRTPPQIKAHIISAAERLRLASDRCHRSFRRPTDPLSGLASITSPIQITAEGENQPAQGMAVDRAGNETKIDTSIWIDKTPPTLSLDSIPEGAVLAVKAMPLTFSFSDSLSQIRPDRFNVVMNRVDLSAVFRPQEGQATKTFALADRKYLLTASIEDRAGNKAELTRHFTIDTTPPDLTVTAAEEDRPIKATAIRLAGKAVDATTSIRTLRVNGIDIPLLPKGEFRHPLPAPQRRG
ncbi:MAG: Ig-like domain repeat protein [Candidatus Manganitrophus sp.]|nr:Ig-like domain repeat protein [Candidatus Manganitrophus sp.]